MSQRRYPCDGWHEPARARRIRDRDRMRAYALDVASREWGARYPRDHLDLVTGQSSHVWRDRGGRARSGIVDWDDLREYRKVRALSAETMAGCSCPMCGNPRRHDGTRTFQELRHGQDARMQMAEAGLRCSGV